MVGHRNGRNPGVHGTFGVIDAHHSFEHEGPAPQFPNPGDVLPGGRWGAHPLAVGGEERRAGVAAAVGLVRGGQRRRFERLGPLQEPARPHHALRGHLDRGADVHLLRDLGTAPVAAVRETPVGGDDQADGAGGAGPLHPTGDGVAVAEPVDLEEGLGIGGDDLFDRLAGEGRQPHGGSAGGRGPGDGHLTVGVDRLNTGGRDDHRHRNVLAHHRCRQVALLGGTDDVRGEPQFGERLDIVGVGQALLAAGQQGRVHRFGQVLLRALLRDGDGLEPDVTGH